MKLSDISVRRPVFAAVISLVLVVFGLISFMRLPVQEFPDVESSFAAIQTTYTGASAAVVDSRITEVIEGAVGGLEGIETISSSSEDGRSTVIVEFALWRNIDDAANDVRDAVSGILQNLPDDVDPPEISKNDGGSNSAVSLPFSSSVWGREQISEYLTRNLVDRFSALPGVARAAAYGPLYSMRIWIDRRELTARGLTVTDIENALRTENVELPAGSIDSETHRFVVRVQRNYETAQDFKELVIARADDGYLVRLGDVARVVMMSDDRRTLTRGRYGDRVLLALVRQSKANVLEISDAARKLITEIAPTLPKELKFEFGSDDATYVREAIHEIYLTLGIVAAAVIAVIYLFLGSVRAAIIPAITVPICLIATFTVLAAAGLSINMMTLLALLLAIGLVVDDAIVVLENVQRRIDEGEPPLLAAHRGTQQVGFAVLTTTAVVLAVFTPVIFVEGSLGPIFKELGIAIAAAVGFSALVALTLSASLSARLLKPKDGKSTRLAAAVNRNFEKLADIYARVLPKVLSAPRLVMICLAGLIVVAGLLYWSLPKELAPQEDRANLRFNILGPEGASYDSMVPKAEMVRQIILRHAEKDEIDTFYVRLPGSFGISTNYNLIAGSIYLTRDGKRSKSTAEVMTELNKEINAVPGLRGRVTMRQGFSSGGSAPVEFVIQGTSFDELARWRDLIMERAAENPKLIALQSDYIETSPQLRVRIDRDRAGDLGISTQEIGRTLQTLLGGSRVTTFLYEGEERDVRVELEDASKREISDLNNINVRSRNGDLIPLSNVVTVRESAGPSELNRFNRLRAVTISASLAPGYTLGEALDYMEEAARDVLPSTALIEYRGESREFKQAGNSLMLTFVMAFIIVFLVLAAQFESFIHPFIIMLTVPLAVFGGLFGLFIGGSSINAYSQIGIIILVGLAAKNGILIVEFANQLRDQGMAVRDALREAVRVRFRPIVMTNVATALGVVPLILAAGAGAASRQTIGLVILFGVVFATAFTLFVIPVFYDLLARYTRAPHEIDEELEAYEREAARRTPAE